MAIITKIREKAGVAVGVVAVALGLFIVGQDLLSGNSSLFGNAQIVGEIGGNDVELDEFNQEYAKVEQDYFLQNNKAPGETETNGLREQAWNQMVFTKLFGKIYDDLGITCTEAELKDMILGNNIHPSIKQTFVDPNTKLFDKGMVTNFLKSIQAAATNKDPKNAAQTQQAQVQLASWMNFEKKLPEDRKRTKLENLLKSSIYVTKLEAEKEYFAQIAKASFKCLYVPFTDIPDSLVAPTEAEMETWLASNKYRYKLQSTRSIDYLTVKVQPGKDDSIAFKQEIEAIKSEFATATNDTLFASGKSDEAAALQSLSPSQLPADLAPIAASLSKGSIIGPMIQGNAYTIYKVVDVVNEGDGEARASHILFKMNPADEADKKNALAKANDILSQIKKGASFEEMARVHGTDGTAPNGGDLGFFGPGRMVKKFEDAVFNAKGLGLIPNVVETEFGYHLIKVTSPKNNLKYKVLPIKKIITAGDKTRQETYAKAYQLKGLITDRKSFNEAYAKDKSLMLSSGFSLTKTSYGVNEIEDGRSIIRWAFNESDTGKVSDVFELNDRYVIAILSKVTVEGEVNLAGVKDAVKSEVVKDKKTAKILEKLGNSGKIEDLAAKYGAGAKVLDNPDAILSGSSLPEIGFDPTLLGKMFGLKQGAEFGPTRAENGVVAARMVSFTDAPKIADYKMYTDGITTRRSGSVQFFMIEAVKELEKVVDDRIKFF